MTPRHGNALPARSMGFILVLVALLSGLGPFSVDTYLPALPAIAEAFDVGPKMVQFTISGYLIGVGLFPMILTPISDAIGRKPVLYVCLAGFVLMSVACAYATSIEQLILFRVLQAAAGGTVMTTSRTVVADYFSGNALSRATSLMMIVFTIAPVIAPLIGGYAFDFGGWSAVFVVLAAIGSVLLILSISLPESLPIEKRRPYHVMPLLREYKRLMRDPKCLKYLLIAGLSCVYFFAMLGASPFIFVEHFGISEVSFAWLFSAVAFAALIGNGINAKVVMRVGYYRMTIYAFYAVGLVTLFLTVFAATNLFGKIGIWGVMASLMAIFHVFLANTTAGLMKYATSNAGAASASLSLFRFVGGALGSIGFGFMGTTHPWGFLVILAFSFVLMGIVLWFMPKEESESALSAS